jgi:uncharacterized protein DUF4384/LPP20 lipoprotein
MSSNSVRVGILLVLSALTSCTASTNTERATVPPPSGRQESGKDFLSDTRQQYPSDLYLTGIGAGTSERAATELARADLLKKVRAEVRVTWTDLMLERSGRTEQEVSRLVETRVMELVKGIEVVNQWRDSRTGVVYCVLALPKTEASNILQATQGQREVARESPEAFPVLTDGIWVTAEGTVFFGDDTTIAEARMRSRDEARRKAIEQAIGVFVRASTVVYNFGLAEDLVHSIVRGVVIEEQILSEGLREVDIGKGQKALIHDTTLRALIRPVPAERRNHFAIKGNLNKSIFFANEEMVITVAASEAAYIHIFNVEQDNAVTVLFPNKFRRDNFLNGKKELIFPDDELREMGVRLRVIPPAGVTKALEKIKLIATKRNLDLPQGKFNDASFQTYKGHDTGLVTDLMKELTKLEDTEWAEMTVSYEVLKK